MDSVLMWLLWIASGAFSTWLFQIALNASDASKFYQPVPFAWSNTVKMYCSPSLLHLFAMLIVILLGPLALVSVMYILFIELLQWLTRIGFWRTIGDRLNRPLWDICGKDK